MSNVKLKAKDVAAKDDKFPLPLARVSSRSIPSSVPKKSIEM